MSSDAVGDQDMDKSEDDIVQQDSTPAPEAPEVEAVDSAEQASNTAEESKVNDETQPAAGDGGRAHC